MYGVQILRNEDMEKAERIIQKFSRRFVHNGNGTFILDIKPYRRELCMKCKGEEEICPFTKNRCPRHVAIEELLLGYRALLYARIKTQIILAET